MTDTNALEEINTMIREQLNYDINMTKNMYLEDGQNEIPGLVLNSLKIVNLIVLIEWF